MKKLFLSFLAMSVAMLTWAANPGGTYHVTKALLNYCSSYTFTAGEEVEITSGEDTAAWDVDVTVAKDGTCTVSNLMNWKETLTGKYDAEEGKIVLPAQALNGFEGLAVCGGIEGYTTAEALIENLNKNEGRVAKPIVAVTLSYNQVANSLTLDTPILPYVVYDIYYGYVGFIYEGFDNPKYADLANLISGMDLKATPYPIEIKVNEAEGVQVMVDTADDNYTIEFEKGVAEVSGAEVIKIYNVKPYVISSVVVDGEEAEAIEAGEYYFIDEVNGVKSIVITVKEIEVVDMVMNVTVNGLNKFQNLAIMGKGGELTGAIAMEANFVDGEAVEVHFDNFDLPLQIYGSWADGNDYTMTVALDDTDLKVIALGTTAAQCVDIEPVDGANLVISLEGEALPAGTVTLTVNEPEGVRVVVETADDNYTAIFYGKTLEINEPQYIRIYNAKPYLISSVKVNGVEIEAIEGGEYYFIEANAATKTIDIEVEKQEVIEMSMTVTVNGLDKFENLAIMSKGGEISGAIAMEANFVEGEATKVYFDNFDLPLEIFGSWANGTKYTMEVTLDGEEIIPVATSPTTAQFVNIEPADGAEMVITLSGSVIPSQTVTLTVNEAAGVMVVADTEEVSGKVVKFEDGKAEVEGAQYIRIYNVDPYAITSVKVNGEEIAAQLGGRSYFIEMTAAIETIDITVEEQEEYEMTMIVSVEGLEKFEELVILDKDGENGKAIAIKDQLSDEPTVINFSNLDLPLQIYGSWIDGTNYEMTVTVDGKNIEVLPLGNAAQCVDVEVPNNARMVISLTGEVIPAETVTLTVNEPEGVMVWVDTAEDFIEVEFEDGKAEVEAPMYITIYNVDPYIITSVKVNGEEIAAEEGGRYYFIEPNITTKTIDITVEEQEVVEMEMYVYVPELDKFESLIIMDKDGELGKALAFKEQLSAEDLNVVYFTNLDLPLQLLGTWEYGYEYKMEVTLNDIEVPATQEGPTSALFMDVWVEDGEFLTIALKGETTAINKVEAESLNGKWYNLQGMEVNKANLLPGNIYINGGKKYLVK